jgi:hypothetical protein
VAESPVVRLLVWAVAFNPLPCLLGLVDNASAVRPAPLAREQQVLRSLARTRNALLKPPISVIGWCDSQPQMERLLHTIDVILKMLGGLSALALLIRIITAIVILAREALQTRKILLEIRELRRRERDQSVEDSGIAVAAVEPFQQLSIEAKRRLIREHLLKGERLMIEIPPGERGGDDVIILPDGKLYGDISMPSPRARWLWTRFGVADLVRVLIVVVVVATLAIFHRSCVGPVPAQRRREHGCLQRTRVGAEVG